MWGFQRGKPVPHGRRNYNAANIWKHLNYSCLAFLDCFAPAILRMLYRGWCFACFPCYLIPGTMVTFP